MKPFESEPEIRVGLHTCGAPVIEPRGEVDITMRDGRVYYTPLNDLSSMMVHNLRIGVGFHWQHTIASAFAGRIEVDCRSPWQAVNSVPVEQYITSVIGSEMNPLAFPEFLKAHAIISRGWALRQIYGTHDGIRSSSPTVCWEDGGDHDTDNFDICNDDHCQRYQGMGNATAYAPGAQNAVNQTRGLVLTDKSGTIADTRFSKCCGGRTEIFSTCWQDMDYDYLVSQPDPWCDLGEMDEERRLTLMSRCFKDYDINTDGGHDWTADIDTASVADRIHDRFGIDIGDVTDLVPLHRGMSGRIDLLRISGTNGSVDTGKELTIRRLLSADCLRSSMFNVTRTSAGFHLTGHGWGHGVGLCQLGAARMASEGASFTDILEFYYPGTTLKRLYD